ncbi:MAG: PQQ-like beta-propeller repeat protein [Planctomycetaceae bacterium]|nr:PQQ-like beta-propeller repeat protein [Planctomycetaceae bacterium]
MNALFLRVAATVFLIPLAAGILHADDWPQWMGRERDAVWSEDGIIDKFPKDGPKVLWRAKIRGGYSGPAVADGLVYVMDFDTDADTKKLSNPGKRPEIKGKERVLCLDAKDGQEVWKHEYECEYAISYPAGPRCTPTVHHGKVYTLGAEGNLYCLDAKKGTVLWSKNFAKDYGAKTAVWGYASHPLVDGKRLICVVGGEGSLVVAFDKDTGKELWKTGTASEQGYSPPTIISAGGRRQLIIWDADKVASLDPEKGTVYWEQPLKPSYGMSIMAPRLSGDVLFAGGMGGVSKAWKLTEDGDKLAVEELWAGNAKLGIGPSNATPFIEDETIYGFDAPGIMRAVDLKTGKRLWSSTAPLNVERQQNHGTGFLVKQGGRFFLFTEAGDLVICKLNRNQYEEIDRANLLPPTGDAFGRDVVWSHPAFANQCVYVRNDEGIVCFSLAK